MDTVNKIYRISDRDMGGLVYTLEYLLEFLLHWNRQRERLETSTTKQLEKSLVYIHKLRQKYGYSAGMKYPKTEYLVGTGRTWRIRKTSNMLRGIFKMTHNFVNTVSKDTKEYSEVKKQFTWLVDFILAYCGVCDGQDRKLMRDAYSSVWEGNLDNIAKFYVADITQDSVK